MKFYSHCKFHIGDNIVHLHFLRKLKAAYPDYTFIHALPLCYHDQLREVVDDLVELIPLEDAPAGSFDVWKNADEFWVNHELRWDYSGFYVRFFQVVANRMGLISPIRSAADLLFSYPALLKLTPLSRPFDILFINSRPCSGQFMAYDRVDYFDPLISELVQAGHSVIVTQKSELPVICTQDYGLTITGIGNLSLFCKYIVMVSTGPSWPTFNVWNINSVKFRVVCLEKETLNMSRNTVQAKCIDQVRRALVERGLL